MSKKKVIGIVALTAFITAFLSINFTAAVFQGRFPISPPTMDKVEKVYNILGAKYYKNVNTEKATDGAIRGMLASLGDPYTTYMNKSEWNQFNTLMSGSYSGIGVSITPDEKDNTIVVVTAFEGSPAAKAGIKTGDKILKIDGKKVTGKEMDSATAKIKGKTGTYVTVTFLKADTKKQVDLKLKRENIDMKTVYYEKKGNIAYLRISIFDTNTGEEFQQNLNKAISDGAKGLIIDVRQNGGGVTTSVEKVASSLMNKGLTIYYTKDKQGKEEYHKTTQKGANLPIAILVDGGTASASEILSAAVRDNKKGFLVGEKTFGKGLVQETFSLGDGSVVKVTIQRYFTPNGTDINKHGITPDYVVAPSKDGKTDPQLNKAIELLKEKL